MSKQDETRPAGWLLKTDPDTYKFEDLERDKKTVWDGVTNALALKHLRGIKKGDTLLIYHTGDEKAIVGVAQAASNSYPDPKKGDPKLAVIDVKPVKRVKTVTLAEVKQVPELASFPLVRMPRLSVMPVSQKEFKLLSKMARL
jgi:predicted RNA-binding protein with PUA-like domain